MATGRYLFVGLDTGGTWKPMLGLAGLLVRAGHSVAVLGSPSMRSTSVAAGCDFVELPAGLDEPPGVAIEDDDWVSWQNKVCGPEVAVALGPAVEQIEADVLVIDFLQFNALSAAELLTLPLATVVHFEMDWYDSAGDWDAEVELVNVTRVGLGLAPLPVKGGLAQLWGQADVRLSLPPALWTVTPVPANVVLVGPIAAAPRLEDGWNLPWDQQDPRPLVVISLSSTYQHQESVLERIAAAAAQLPVHVVLSLAGAVPAADVRVPAGVVVRDWIEFDAVFPRASALVTHGGMATLSAGLLNDLPMLVLPHGRDQSGNAKKLADCGAAEVLDTDATIAQIREKLSKLLTDPAYRVAAENQGALIRSMGRGPLAVSELERLLQPGFTHPAR